VVQWLLALETGASYPGMPPIEKHGALWEPSREDQQIVFEQLDESSGCLAIVFHRADGLFLSVVFEKIGDHQWILPWWSERRPEALFDVLDDAKRHLTALLKSQA
jgi:hypothetical protein